MSNTFEGLEKMKHLTRFDLLKIKLRQMFVFMASQHQSISITHLHPLNAPECKIMKKAKRRNNLHQKYHEQRDL